MAFTLKNPDAPMSYKQGIMIRNLGGGDARGLELTQQEASDKIGELMAAKGNGKTATPKVDLALLYESAMNAGYNAGVCITPTPMNIAGYEPVMDGSCGFAWVNFKMKGGLGRKFGQWLIKEGYARRDTWQGGCTIWISDHNQSEARKLAHASKMATVLQEAGIEDAYATSRAD